MTLPALSPDQAEAWDAIAEALAQTGIDLASEEVAPAKDGKGRVMAVIGKAGSGKTLLLAELTKALKAAGVDLVSGDYEGKKRKDRRTVAILAPTNKAAFVLRMRGVAATFFTLSISRPDCCENSAGVLPEGYRPCAASSFQ